MAVGEVTEFVFNCTQRVITSPYVKCRGNNLEWAEGIESQPPTYKTTDADITPR